MVNARVQEASSRQIISYDPATLEKLGSVHSHTKREVAAALCKARDAQPRWEALTAEQRGRLLLRARDHLIDKADEVAELISRENGKPVVEALVSEIFPVIYLIDYFARHGAKMLRDEPIDLRAFQLLGRRSILNRTARGVVGIIAPWNYPFTIPAGEICMALMAGNAVLLKPARATCLIGEMVGEIYNAAGLPEGLVQVIHGSGTALLDQKLDFVAFTGSVDVGKKVMARAAQHLTPVMLELGGKDPAIVCADANLEVAASAAVWGAFANSGQVCASIERLYVHESIADAFIDKVVQKTLKLRQGRGLDPSVDVGAMCTEEQLELVKAHVDNAREKGASILTGGELNPDAGLGYFYKPTVMTHVGQDWQCVQEETFGPTLPILTYRDETEAIEKANDSAFGLTASIWTRDLRRGRRMAKQLVAGTVTINDALVTHGFPETPWGGYKDTGVGRTHGRAGLLEFTDLRHIHTNPLSFLKNPWWYGPSPAPYAAFRGIAHLLRTGWRPKLRGAKEALPALVRAMTSRY